MLRPTYHFCFAIAIILAGNQDDQKIKKIPAVRNAQFNFLAS